MVKRRLHHFKKRLHILPVWLLMITMLATGATTILSLRQNNLNMVRLREAVYQTDQQNGDVESALKTLREYIYGHMNTNLSGGNNNVKPPIQLKYRYERLVQAEKDRVSNANTQIYTDAQNYCEKLYPHGLSGGGRVPCIKDYVSTHGVKENTIPESLYKFDFVSPAWTPDLAGWSMVATLGLAVIFIVRFILDRWLKNELHDQL